MVTNEFAEDLAAVFKPPLEQRVVWCDAEHGTEDCNECELFLDQRCEGCDPDAEIINIEWGEETPTG